MEHVPMQHLLEHVFWGNPRMQVKVKGPSNKS